MENPFVDEFRLPDSPSPLGSHPGPLYQPHRPLSYISEEAIRHTPIDVPREDDESEAGSPTILLGEAQEKQPPRHRRRKKLCIAISAGVVIAILLGVAIGLVTKKDHSRSANANEHVNTSAYLTTPGVTGEHAKSDGTRSKVTITEPTQVTTRPQETLSGFITSTTRVTVPGVVTPTSFGPFSYAPSTTPEVIPSSPKETSEHQDPAPSTSQTTVTVPGVPTDVRPFTSIEMAVGSPPTNLPWPPPGPPAAQGTPKGVPVNVHFGSNETIPAFGHRSERGKRDTENARNATGSDTGDV
ncbi:hypothetical protein LTR37_008305 [Vermiconidia calcicola]|uniref:Uncharacterized protein n=1 Tax=Vermiconidia calcicola TaxID=1690605 RepID=A0ACC3NBC4_9PEZI|nr:hypothetical protein LTR37_008305 [Vermiconidia calcicola]